MELLQISAMENKTPQFRRLWVAGAGVTIADVLSKQTFVLKSFRVSHIWILCRLVLVICPKDRE